MEAFVNSISTIILLAIVLFIFGYAIRHRGRIIRWLDNINHAGNVDEKEEKLSYLKHRKDNIEREIAKLEPED